MPTPHADATEGGPQGPSESVWNDQDVLENFARLLGDMIVSHSGEPTPEAQAQFDLRSASGRGKILSALVAELQPREVSPAIWLRWIEGGETPFTQKGLRKPVKPDHSVKKELTRGATSTRSRRQRVADLEDELAHARDALAYQEAMDKSLLDWSISDHIIKLCSSIFAMGPAWALMRSVSAYISDEDAAEQSFLLDGDLKKKYIAELRATRKKESEVIFDALDFWVGNYEFEKDIRAGVLRVIAAYEERRPEWVEAGHRRRSKAAIMKSANPQALDDYEGVLDGLKRS